MIAADEGSKDLDAGRNDPIEWGKIIMQERKAQLQKQSGKNSETGRYAMVRLALL